MSIEYEVSELRRALNSLINALNPWPMTIEEHRILNESISEAKETLAIWDYIRDLEEDVRLNGPLK